MSWWKQVLSFLLFYIVTMKLFALLGGSATVQLLAGIFCGVIGTMALNALARHRMATGDASVPSPEHDARGCVPGGKPLPPEEPS